MDGFAQSADSKGTSASASQNLFTHDAFTHKEDGQVCIWIAAENYWFVPYDVGGEGFACTRNHH